MIALRFRDVLPPYVADELDGMIAQLKAWATREHNEDGTHRPDAAETHLVPTGALTMYVNTTPPSGWLLCDGTEVSRVTYAALFEVIGIQYGAGDGVLTFNLPDLRQRFPLGKAVSGTGAALGATGGNINHTHAAGTLAGPSHSHSISNQAAHTHTVSGATASEASHTHSFSATTSVNNINDAADQTGATVGFALQNHTHTVSGTTGAGSSHNHAAGTLAADSGGAHDHGGSTGNSGTGSVTGSTGSANPPYQVVQYIIKT